MNTSIKIDGFQNIEKIVDASYWSLFRAENVQSGTRHLVQVLNDSASKDARLVALFKELSKTNNILHHDNILTPIDFEQTAQHTFLIYEDLPAQSLQAEIESKTLPVEEEVTSIIREAAEALQFAQIRGVRHGWVMPEMILRSHIDSTIKIIGFGSERIFAYLYDKRPDIAALLNPYLPPEHLAQAEQPKPDDCYALGVIFYRALTGTLPFDAMKIVDLVNQKSAPLNVDKLSANASPSIIALVTALLDPKPFRRATYSSLLNELSPQNDTIELLDQPPHEQEIRFSRVRDMVSDANPFNKINSGGPSKIAYTSAIAVFVLVLLFSIFIVARLVSNDKKRMQDIYAEYLADQQYEQRNEGSGTDNELSEDYKVQNDVYSIQDVERNNEPTVSVENALELQNTQMELPEATGAEDNPVSEPIKAELAVSVSAQSENVTAEIFVNGERYGYSDTKGACTISELLVNKTYRIRVVRDGWQQWERSVYIKDGENALDVKLQPEVEQHPSFTFMAVPFADQIKVNDESVARNLPCTIQLPPGTINVTYIDSKAVFSWRTSFDLNENESKLSVDAEQVGTGEVVIVLNDPIQYGYAFVRVDENEQQHTTPLRASLTAGWHRIRVFRENYSISPADTTVFIKPGVKLNIRCKVL